MSKSQLLKESRAIICDLISEAQLEQDESIHVQYKGAYIHLHRTGYFEDEMNEYIFNYYKIVNDKVYEVTSFAYDKKHTNKTHVNGWYFDHTTSHIFKKITPKMNLKNLIFPWENFRDKL
jgi:hypothetical protein